MKIFIMTMFLVFGFFGAVSAQTVSYSNIDRIGTFGGEWPFPLGPEADLPFDNLEGIWEVRESEDGAYILITGDYIPGREKPKFEVHLFDPCTFELTARGSAQFRENTLYSTMIYPTTDMKVKIQLKSYYESDKNLKAHTILMVMKGNTKEMDKFFPVKKVELGEIAYKCKK